MASSERDSAAPPVLDVPARVRVGFAVETVVGHESAFCRRPAREGTGRNRGVGYTVYGSSKWAASSSVGRGDVLRALLSRPVDGTEAGSEIYDRDSLRKWVLWASLVPASFVETAGKSALARRGEGHLARVACGMK